MSRGKTKVTRKPPRFDLEFKWSEETIKSFENVAKKLDEYAFMNEKVNNE